MNTRLKNTDASQPVTSQPVVRSRTPLSLASLGLATLSLVSCAPSANRAITSPGQVQPIQPNAVQTYAISCVQAINAVATAVPGYVVPDPDFERSQYRFVNRGSIEIVIYAVGYEKTYYKRKRETWSEFTCTEQAGQATLNIRTTGLSAQSTARLHAQFFEALNLPRP